MSLVPVGLRSSAPYMIARNLEVLAESTISDLTIKIKLIMNNYYLKRLSYEGLYTEYITKEALTLSEGTMDRIFKLKENKTNVRTELIAGLTTFVTMAYVLVVVPDILSAAGIPIYAALAATCISSFVACIANGFYSNYPFALAPGMGLVAFFSFTVVGQMGIGWQQALGLVFISGVIFILLTLTNVREAILDAIPMNLKQAITVGIGIFLAFLGLKNAGWVVPNPATFVNLANLTEPNALLAAIGFVIVIILSIRGVTGAFLIGIAVTTIIGIPMGVTQAPQGIFSLEPLTALGVTAFKLDVMGSLKAGFIGLIFAFTFANMFDTMGTLIGVATRANMLDEQGRLPNAGRPLLVDAGATSFGALLGTSTVTTYLESASGVAAGGRTGLTAVVVGVLFGIALFFAPILTIVPSAATAPVLIIVGVMMAESVLDINFKDFTEAVPAFLTIIMMPLTFNIANGFAFGFISYTLVKVAAGRTKEVSLIMYILSALFLINFTL